MTIALDRMDRINSRARQYQLGKSLVALATLLPFLLGWSARKLVLVVWVVLAWLWAAVVVGWQSAAGPPSDQGRL